MKDTVTLECVYCKERKTLSHYEALNLKDVPLCEKDGGPMVAVSASRKARRRAR